ncbi:hypothetical protein [Sphingosinicella sp. CPCC 101087]|uniref:hypothetical protein n=1 Tax=Sphingosinicella sp. CPCC 101087 TaxID=2497754 RepID=UPI00101CDA57|nr:hypothetical protein [Sphingosinicella sp. CPCC 101087]
MTDKSSYIDNCGPKTSVTGLKAAVIDNAIVTETMMKILNGGGNAADAVVAMVQAAVEPYMPTLPVSSLCSITRLRPVRYISSTVSARSRRDRCIGLQRADHDQANERPLLENGNA